MPNAKRMTHSWWGSREAWEAAQSPAVKHFPDAVRMLRYFVDLGEGMPEKQREAQALLAAIDAEKAASR